MRRKPFGRRQAGVPSGPERVLYSFRECCARVPTMTFRKRTWLAAIALIAVGDSRAAGFAILEQSVKGLGSAFSNTAAAEDASTGFFNAAGLTRLDTPQVQAGAHVIVPSATFEDRGSALNPDLDPFAPLFGFTTGPGSLTGGDSGDAGTAAV